MNGIISWSAREAERPKESACAPVPWREPQGSAHQVPRENVVPRHLPVHSFPTLPLDPISEVEAEQAAQELEQAMEEALDWDRERRMFRGRTAAMLRRYMRFSLETGRLPSLLGREFFRSKVTSYRVTTFEERVIFVHDMENCLKKLDELSRQVLARIVLQEYGHDEASRLLGCTRMTVHRKLLEALDLLSDILLTAGLLEGAR
jgi:hypothetical protein